MRIIIRDILEPTIKRQEDDREEINNLKKMIENFEKRIDDLDYLVNRANFKTSKYDELKRQINAMESTISIKHNETQHKMNEMNQQIT
jgi:predicted RNase H-like nuclease (RuvC/YqgF family)